MTPPMATLRLLRFGAVLSACMNEALGHPAASQSPEKQQSSPGVDFHRLNMRPRKYRVTHLLANLGWVDFDLGSSPGLLGQ